MSDSDAVWKRDEIESPCVKLCSIHPEAKLCVGCFRSIDEITQWSRMNPVDRHRIMAELPDRKGLVMKRRGGIHKRKERA
ncbi:MAG: DUF1289 domain-containing protein [Pseudomonadota bacterium]|nr:DUF1289 domain-containing protein [Pseudomonadota bacterium]